MNPVRRQASLVVLALAIAVSAVAVWLWLDRPPPDPIVEMTDLAQSATTQTGAADEDFPAIEDSSIRDPDDRPEPEPGTFEVVETIPHDTAAFTQGLEFDGTRLFESTGQLGESTLREVDPETGSTLRSLSLDDDVFGEGLTVIGDEIIQLTWQNNVAYRWDVDTFELLGRFDYEGEGWGICDQDGQLVMSNGTADLTTRRHDDFAIVSVVEVTFRGAPVERLNELECVDGRVWANIWLTPLIVEIEPVSGEVLTVIDASALRPGGLDETAVLNGIAYDAVTDTYLLTGKLWPTTYRVRLGGAK